MNNYSTFSLQKVEIGLNRAMPSKDAPKPSVKRSKISEPFILGPLPVRWFRQAYTASKAAHAMALVLWFYKGLKEDKDEFELNLSQLKPQWAISRQTAGRGLRDLEACGLIKVQRKSGSKSKIKMLDSKLQRTPQV